MFACGPAFTLCCLYDWRFVIVLKEAGLASVYNEFLGLIKLHPDNRLKERIVKPVETTRDFRWINGIDYCDSKDQEHQLNVKDFAKRLLEAWPSGLMASQVLDLLDQLRFQIRFDTS